MDVVILCLIAICQSQSFSERVHLMALCPPRWKFLISGCLLVMIMSSLGAAQESAVTAQRREFFERKVRPLLVQHCYECHSGQSEKLHANLYLDNGADILSGGDSGPAVVPGNVDESLLISAVRYESFEMPSRRKLSPVEVKNAGTVGSPGTVDGLLRSSPGRRGPRRRW